MAQRCLLTASPGSLGTPCPHLLGLGALGCDGVRVPWALGSWRQGPFGRPVGRAGGARIS